MRFMHRHRRWLSLSTLAGLFVAMTTPPASAEYNPRTGRYLQRDPNGQALVLQALRHNAENPMVTVSMAYQLQFGDGMNFYEYLRSNPLNHWDPSGLAAMDPYQGFEDLTMDWFAETGTVEDESRGQRLYVLDELNEKARWASLGLQTAVDIGLSLIPGYDIYEAYKSVEIIRSGRGGFMDYMTVGLAGISTVGYAIKAINLVTKGRLWGARAQSGARSIGNTRAFTKSDFRHNMKVRTGLNPGRSVHAHHVLPHQHEALFRARGIDVNDPKFGAWWAQGPHLRAHRAGYNDRWTEFLDRNPTANEILDFGRGLAREYGFDIGF